MATALFFLCTGMHCDRRDRVEAPPLQPSDAIVKTELVLNNVRGKAVVATLSWLRPEMEFSCSAIASQPATVHSTGGILRKHTGRDRDGRDGARAT